VQALRLPNVHVILRGCDFFDFSQKVALKTTGLDAKKSSYRNKVTSSERSEESLFDLAYASESIVAAGSFYRRS
jgi:hypothetical protein